MLPTTIDVIKSVLKTDQTIAPAERSRLIGLLKTGKSAEKQTDQPPRIVRRREAAARLGCSTRAVDKYCHDGILTKIKLPGRTRCSGIVEASLNALINANQGTED